MNRRSLQSLIVLTGLMVACGGGGTASPDSSVEVGGVADEWVQTGGPVVLSQSPFLSDGANAIAIAEGWFEQLGVNVTIEKTRSPSDLVPSAAVGDVDVLFSGVFPGLFTAMSAGAPLVAVAGGSVLSPSGCNHLSLVVLPATLERISFDDPDSLRGLRIATTAASMATARYVDAMLESWGLTRDDVELIELKREAQSSALSQGDVDATVSQEPWATTMRSTLGAVSTNAGQDIIPNELTSMLVFGRRLVDDPELGARVLAAYLRGEAQYREGPTERNLEILSESTGLEPGLLSEMCWTTLDSDGRKYEAELETTLEFGVRNGDIDAVLPPEEIWDHSYRDRALEILAELEAASS